MDRFGIICLLIFCAGVGIAVGATVHIVDRQIGCVGAGYVKYDAGACIRREAGTDVIVPYDEATK